VRNYVISMFKKNCFFSRLDTTHNDSAFTVFMMVRTTAESLMTFTVYVFEQGVCVGDISYVWATKFWNHRQDTEHIPCVSVWLYSSVSYKRLLTSQFRP